MTSMPLTLRSGARGGWDRRGGGRGRGGHDGACSRCESGGGARRLPWVPLSPQRARRDLLLRRVLVGRRLDHRLDDRLVGGVPVGDEVPLRAVPGAGCALSARPSWSAHELTRADHARRSPAARALVVEREVLEAPAHLLAGHRLALAELAWRWRTPSTPSIGADQAAHVQHRADLLLRPGALRPCRTPPSGCPRGPWRRLGAVLQRQRVVALGRRSPTAVTSGSAADHHTPYILSRG